MAATTTAVRNERVGRAGWASPRFGRLGGEAVRYAVLLGFLVVFLLPFVWI